MQTRLRRPLLAAVAAAAVLTAGAAFVGPALASTATTTATAPPVDKTAPTGSFKLNHTSLWVGQRTTLTLSGVADNDSPAATITRVVTWGDGTTSTLSPTQTTIAKAYARAGTFPVRVTLTDQAHNAKVLKSTGVAVTVPGKFKLSTSSVWLGQKFTVALSSVPAGTTKIVLHYGDGRSATLKGKNQTVSSVYYHRSDGTVQPAGTLTLTAVFTNKYGSTASLAVGKITIKDDQWAPQVAITVPAQSHRVSAWSTIRGTATDKGSGIHDVQVMVLRGGGGVGYCYTPAKTWLRVVGDIDPTKCTLVVGVTHGTWSVGLKGLVEGNLGLLAVAEDWSDRSSAAIQMTATLTQS